VIVRFEPGVRKEFVSSETHKVHNVVQSQIESNGEKKTVTVPPKKWSEDYASSSEAIVKADRGGKSIGICRLLLHLLMKQVSR